MSGENKKSFYVWFLGARECPGLRGDHYVRPIVRHLKQKEEEREPSKVTLQISSKGIKLIAESLKHFIPSHAVTFVSQESAPDDDIVSAILLLYNPITKCPIHVHSYRCDSSETAEILRDSLQNLVDLPENKRKIRDLEDRLQSQGLYLSSQTESGLLKSCDTGFGGSSADLLTPTDSEDDEHVTRAHEAVRHAPKPSPKMTSATKDDEEERITRLFDSLAAELRDKLANSAAPLLLPPRDYQAQPKEKSGASRPHRVSEYRKHQEDSSGPSSGIGSDLEEQQANSRGLGTARDQFKVRSHSYQQQRVSSCEKLDHRKRHSYHESGSSMMDRRNLGRSANDLTKIRENPKDRYYIKSKEDINEERDEFPGRGKVKEVLSMFESKQESSRANRSKSFCNETPGSWQQNSRQKSRTSGYQELTERERYPGLDRETARTAELHQQSFSRQRRSEQRQKNSDFLYRNSDFDRHEDSVPVFVETLGNGHFRAVRDPLSKDMKSQGVSRR